ncbi:OmpH family outer membrane protein [Taylorella equigenitalis]|uniref:Outer membrane protein n=1 Tax=Taylorella equigenitalis ATCC 35865 TaxID=743973 RepID=A0ABN4AZ02_9BURK|nr:OmpH family outer membrane protein [Taylorella equigenitalis]AFN35877.1 putative outer membrane protein [Taylorella equigenitalis ATCC 35865]ASY30516.1 molecular chaperone Skp [Taylorella equigenitalis]ASY37823.1 molecular chaperone Skp [Taylorella equigenitalis]ASY39291.1 molecular chaperone Skp [Taylorella equigenitalis]ASY42244.1 molecular chaperone Skp [Taylorella equigenitalis]
MIKINRFLVFSVASLAFSVSAIAQNQKAPAPVAKDITKSTETKQTETKTTENKSFVPKIGFVNTNKLLSESAPAKEAERKIEEEFKKRDTELQKLANDLRTKYENFDKNAPVMTDSDRAKAQRELSDLDTNLQRKRREFQEDFNRRRQDAFAQIVDKANSAIQQIASEEDYDIIIQEAVAVSDRVDITEKVIKALESKK